MIVLTWIARDMMSDLPIATDHLGLGYIAAVLQSDGFEVTVLPAQLSAFPAETIYRPKVPLEERETLRDIARNIMQCNPTLVGLLISFQEDAPAAFALASSIKDLSTDVQIVAGGHFVSFNSDKVLRDNPCVDGVVIGEGEYTMLELCKHCSATNMLGAMAGLQLRNRPFVPRALVENLDTLPYPSRQTLSGLLKSGFTVSDAYISGSRGCMGRCTYCSVHSFYGLSPGHMWRGRSPESIIGRLNLLKKVIVFTFSASRMTNS